MTDSALSYEAWCLGMKAAGYTAADRSPQGSTLFTATGKPSYRVASFPPNEATAAWMKRTGTLDGRCKPIDGQERLQSILPEFGLERTDDYHSDYSEITRTMLTRFLESPVEYQAMYLLGTMEYKKATNPIQLGLICHMMLLEHKRADEACIAYPQSCFSDGGRIRTKAAEAFAASVKPLIAVRESTIPVIEKIVESARASPFGRLLDIKNPNAKFEHTVRATLWGLPCKCRPDLHIVLPDQVICPDLKFGAFKPDDWRRSRTRFKYWLQQCHYSAILRAHYQRPVSWSFWAGETKPPWRFGPKDYDQRSIELAAERHKQLIIDLRRCYETDVWQDNFSTTSTIEPWEIEEPGYTSSEESTDPVELDHYDSTESFYLD